MLVKKALKKYNNMSIATKAGIWFVICSCIQSGIKFVSLPIFANIIPLEEYGKVTMYTTWMSVVLIFSTLSFGKANGVFYVAMVKYPNNKKEFTTSLESLTILLCTLSIPIFYLSTILFGDWMGIGYSQYLCMCLELIGYGIILLASLEKRFDYDYKELLKITFLYTFGTIVIPIIGILFCPKFIPMSHIKNWSGAISSLLIGLSIYFKSIKNSKKIWVNEYCKYATKFNLALIPHYLSNVVLAQSDRIMIANMISKSAAAIYNVAYTLGIAVQVITQALINAINPWMYKKISNNSGKGIGNVIISLTGLIAILVLLVCLVMPECFTIFFPPIYKSALYVIPPVAVGILWSFIFNIYASIELYFSGNKTVSISSFIGAFVNVILNLIFIPKYGFIAAAYTTLTCYIIYSVLHTVFANKYVNKHIKYNIIPNKYIWSIGILTTLISHLIMLLYPYYVVRYVILIIILFLSFIFRKKIIFLISFNKKKEGI